MTSAVRQDDHADARLYQHALLSRVESDALLAKYRAAADRWGPTSKRALRVRNELITLNLRLVAHVAGRYTPPSGMTAEDLRAFGVFGLITAIEKFDLSKGAQFSIYATWWIRHSIGRAIADLCGLVRVPVHASSELSKVDREGGTDERRQLLHDAANARRMCSLDMPVSTNEGSCPWVDLLAGASLDAADALDDARNAEALDAAIAELPERLRFVLTERLEEKTLAEVGRDLEGGRSRERVRQLEQEAHALLRAKLAAS